jgi:hypothetical protein
MAPNTSDNSLSTVFNSASNIPWLKGYINKNVNLSPTAVNIAGSIPSYYSAAKNLNAGTPFYSAAASTPLSSADTGSESVTPAPSMTSLYGGYTPADVLAYQSAYADNQNQSALKYLPAYLSNINAAKAQDLAYQLQGDISSPTRQAARNQAIGQALGSYMAGEAGMLSATSQAQNAASNFAALGSSPRGNRTFG